MPRSPLRLLLLGGTTEASALARALAGDARVACTLSLAGRTRAPVLPPGGVRIGGFGGAAGLAAFLRDGGFDAVVDATHPFAATITANAIRATQAAGVSLLLLRRPAWQAQPGDRWMPAADMAAAAAALGDIPRRVLLTIGQRDLAAFAARQPDLVASAEVRQRDLVAFAEVRQPDLGALAEARQRDVAAFAEARPRDQGGFAEVPRRDPTAFVDPCQRDLGGGADRRGEQAASAERQGALAAVAARRDDGGFAGARHRYLVRSVDPPDPAILPGAVAIAARGPFALADEIELLRTRRIEVLVTKNAGGTATAAKLAAARALGIAVVMVARPPAPDWPAVADTEAALRWIRDAAERGPGV